MWYRPVNGQVSGQKAPRGRRNIRRCTTTSLPLSCVGWQTPFQASDHGARKWLRYEDMSRAKQRKRAFLLQHPICCFCGGEAAAEGEDHIPSRQFFDRRSWPESYVFPACHPCNQKTRHLEQIVAFVARSSPSEYSPAAREEMRKIIRAVANNYPKVFSEIRGSARAKRRLLKSLGIKKPTEISTADLSLMHLGGPIVKDSIDLYGRKLLLAMHYKHSGRIVPRDGIIAVRWYTNIDVANEAIPQSVIEMLGGLPKIMRGRTSLHKQFGYRYGVSDEGDLAMYFVRLRGTIHYVGVVSFVPQEECYPPRCVIYNPWDHSVE